MKKCMSAPDSITEKYSLLLISVPLPPLLLCLPACLPVCLSSLALFVCLLSVQL